MCTKCVLLAILSNDIRRIVAIVRMLLLFPALHCQNWRHCYFEGVCLLSAPTVDQRCELLSLTSCLFERGVKSRCVADTMCRSGAKLCTLFTINNFLTIKTIIFSGPHAQMGWEIYGKHLQLNTYVYGRGLEGFLVWNQTLSRSVTCMFELIREERDDSAIVSFLSSCLCYYFRHGVMFVLTQPNALRIL